MSAKRFLIVMCIFFVASWLGGCSDDDDPTAPPPLGTDPALLPGTWDLTGVRSDWNGGSYTAPPAEIEADPLTYILAGDGSGTIVYQGSSSGMMWSATGSTLTFSTGSAAQSYTFGVSQTTMTLKFDVQDDELYHITHTFTRRSGLR